MQSHSSVSPDRIGEVVDISGRRLVVTPHGVLLARMKRPELLKHREERGLSAEELGELQAAVRITLGRCASLSTTDGLPCRAWPKPGAVLCPTHGGRLPTHLARAERILAAIRLPGLEFIAREIERASEETCHECGFPSHSLKERKHVASLVWRLLDRAGLPPTKKLEVTTNADRDVTLDGWTTEERQELRAGLDTIKALKLRVEGRLLREEAEKRLSIRGEVIHVPQRVIEAHQGMHGDRPAEADLDPIDE